jgi:nitrous oxidase accessory protein
MSNGARIAGLFWVALTLIASNVLGQRPHETANLPPRTAASASLPGDIVVDPHGPIATLHGAIQLARRHSRIVVRAGTYREPTIVVDKPLTIVGQGWPTFLGTEHDVLLVTGDSVTIRGVVIRHVTPTGAEDRAGIRFSGARHCTLEHSRFYDTFFAVYLAKSSHCRIDGNTIVGTGTIQALSGNGIHSWSSRDLTIVGNDITGHRDGIYLEFTTGSVIRGNRSTRNLRYGLHFMFSHHCEYLDNSFTANGAGVAVMFSDSVIMRRNRFQRSWGSAAYGLLLKELRDSRIEENRFLGNTVGLWTEGTSRVVVTANDFSENGWALRVLGDATDNQFRGNQFVGNSFDVGTAPGQNSNVFDGNYWDRYRGYDLDHNGYGDVPFQPVRLFSLFVQQSEPALILLHSFFTDLLDLAERVIPSLTAETMMDRRPLMRAGT